MNRTATSKPWASRFCEAAAFTRAEADRGAAVAVVSESTAKHYWPGLNPLGQHFSLGELSTTNGGSRVAWQDKFKDYEVIGMARDIRFRDVAVNDPSHVFLPLGVLTQGAINGGLVFRIAGDRGKALAAVQSAVETVDRTLLPDMQVMSFEEGPVTMHRDVDRLVLRPRKRVPMVSERLPRRLAGESPVDGDLVAVHSAVPSF